MSTERQSPDALLVQTALTGTVADIDDDPDSPDAAWLVYDGTTNGNTDCRVSFPTPTGPPTTGANLQEFRVQIRKNASGGNATTWSLALWENGAQVAELATGTTTALAPNGEVVSGTWDASSLGTADGSLVECRLEQTSGGSSGQGANRRRIEIGAVEWNVDYTEQADNPVFIAATVAMASTVAAVTARVRYIQALIDMVTSISASVVRFSTKPVSAAINVVMAVGAVLTVLASKPVAAAINMVSTISAAVAVFSATKPIQAFVDMAVTISAAVTVFAMKPVAATISMASSIGAAVTVFSTKPVAAAIAMALGIAASAVKVTAKSVAAAIATAIAIAAIVTAVAGGSPPAPPVHNEFRGNAPGRFRFLGR